MKKLLAILGTMAISLTGASLVIACDNPAKKESKSSVDKPGSKPVESTNSGSNETSNQGSNEGSNKEKDNSKPSKPASGTASLVSKTDISAWSSIFMDSITGEDIQDYSAEEKEAADKAKNKEFVEVLDEVNKLSATFEKELKALFEKVKEAKEQADKLAKQKEAADKAKNKEFVEVLDEVNKLSATFEKELKQLAQKFKEIKEKLAKEKELKDQKNNKEFVEVLDEVNKLSATFEKELKALFKKIADNELEKERLYKEFTTSSSNATEYYFETLDTKEEVREWNFEKGRLVELISSIDRQVKELKGSGQDIKSVIDTVESNLRNYKDNIENQKNSKVFWKYEMWSYWLEDVLANLKKQK
ncbi:lipoprotein [Mycoplasma mycoides]|uniref:lipoprotein n=1 Tax=Mycoplasma mycoides TaxID=2102 RepID=UPI0027327B3D|nr:lipoprotein [Mycoplasma mycoides]MDP4040770.1 lipoprotein [Mycoplasma mycoides]MDP4041646.1 lipoprotein [Mycoplasma mycoides]MDP4042518.1 lipoprotein [Mycoplasma mycoides]MDP4043992.1 lipoprotein [Mycoplasma mycoides]MDP4044898.1 lipoprotein [Mycoplasma mycoides]